LHDSLVDALAQTPANERRQTQEVLVHIGESPRSMDELVPVLVHSANGVLGRFNGRAERRPTVFSKSRAGLGNEARWRSSPEATIDKTTKSHSSD
jgi:predicted Zn-dependent protease with MMP-like domain